jgi:5-methylcytosine-specific restriction enzyme subunit McrC
MNEVFESFVATALREALGLPAWAWRRGGEGTGVTLDVDEIVGLEPDMSWWEGGRCVFVADAKYKRVNAAGVKHADLYQLLAYLVALDLPRGLLVYAAGEAMEAKYTVRHAGKELHVRSIDLAGTPDEVLAELGHLAELVKCLRANNHGLPEQK